MKNFHSMFQILLIFGQAMYDSFARVRWCLLQSRTSSFAQANLVAVNQFYDVNSVAQTRVFTYFQEKLSVVEPGGVSGWRLFRGGKTVGPDVKFSFFMRGGGRFAQSQILNIFPQKKGEKTRSPAAKIQAAGGSSEEFPLLWIKLHVS